VSPELSADWIARQAAARATKTAVVDLRTAREFSYRELHERVDRLATFLHRELGVDAGDRVAVYSQNNSNIFEVQFACWRLGAILVPLNWRLALPELEFILGDCSPVVLLHEAGFADQAVKLCASAGVKHVVAWDTDAEVAGAIAYEDALASSEVAVPVRPTDFDTPLVVMYTSGTTGRPKGAVITQGMTFWNVVNLTEFFACSSEMVNLAALPLFHIGGLNVYGNPAFYFGGTTLVMHAFDPSEAVRLLGDAELAITHYAAAVANWQFMSQTEAFEHASSFPHLVGAGVGAQPVPVALIRTWLDKGVSLQECFGMTETCSFVSAITKHEAARKIGSAGMPAMNTAVRLVDEHGIDIGPGEVGEMWVRGPCVTPGYWNHPEATSELITDGWFHTGDAARRDDEGFYYIVDRWKDMYVSGGENVYPAEVEDVVYQLPEVGEVAVIGVPDERWGEAGSALVVVREGASLSDEAILEHCRANLAKFKVPKSIGFVDALPRNAMGKVLKRELRARHGAD
jgi:fatty-acyl-CoA synthase